MRSLMNYIVNKILSRILYYKKQLKKSHVMNEKVKKI